MNTTLTTGSAIFVDRGDEMRFCGPPVVSVRVLRASEHTVTFRRYHRWRWLEWLHARWEERVAWPLADWKAK